MKKKEMKKKCHAASLGQMLDLGRAGGQGKYFLVEDLKNPWMNQKIDELIDEMDVKKVMTLKGYPGHSIIKNGLVVLFIIYNIGIYVWVGVGWGPHVIQFCVWVLDGYPLCMVI